MGSASIGLIVISLISKRSLSAETQNIRTVSAKSNFIGIIIKQNYCCGLNNREVQRHNFEVNIILAKK